MVSSSYAPPNKQLLSVSTLGLSHEDDIPIEQRVQQELKEWFGQKTESWRHIKSYQVRDALPSTWGEQSYKNFPKEYIYCGDYTEHPSIQGALRSGEKAAERVVNDGLR